MTQNEPNTTISKYTVNEDNTIGKDEIEETQSMAIAFGY